MLQQDYIMRLIQEFFKALRRVLEKKDPDVRLDAIKDMYRQYVGEYEFYQAADIDAIMQAMGSYAEEQRIHRLEMLAELYYVESDLKPLPMGESLLQKALALFYYIDRNSGTYSFDRINKIADIQRRLLQSQSGREDKY